MANNNKRRGMNPVLAFLLGFLLALILVIGSVAGIIYFALNYKLDKIQANKDGEGNYIYVNADPDDGGAATVLELIKKVSSLVSSGSSLTLGEIEGLLPVTSSLTGSIHDALQQYIDLDMDEVKQVSFSELGGYLQDKLLDVRPAALLDSLGGAPDNKVVDIMLNGVEADYVTDGENLFPVWYDRYEKTGDGYERSDGEKLDPAFGQFLEERDGAFRLYFYSYGTARSSSYYITQRDEEGIFVFAPEEEYAYDVSDTQTATLTGNYYYDGEEKIEVTPVTLRSFSDGSAVASLNEVYLSELIEADDEVTKKLVDGVTLGEIIEGKVNFKEIVDGIDITVFVNVEPSDSIMVFLAYSVADVETAEDGNSCSGVYYPQEGEPQEVLINTENGKISQVVFMQDGEKVEATAISAVSSQVSRLTKTLKIKDLISIDEDNKIIHAVGNSTIDSLPEDIANLSINELYSDNIYCGNPKEQEPAPAKMYLAAREVSDAENQIEYDPSYLYYVLEGQTFKLVNSGTEHAGKVDEEQFEEGVYYTYGAPNDMWKLLLCTQENGQKSENAYSVNNINAMITNVMNNTQNATMYELHNAGIMTFDNEQELELTVSYGGETKKIGELKFVELVDYVVGIAGKTQNIAP